MPPPYEADLLGRSGTIKQRPEPSAGRSNPAKGRGAPAAAGPEPLRSARPPRTGQPAARHAEAAGSAVI